ncbi:molybdenum cofactor guanylyltransferase [Methanococcoides alaskense]|uniref:Probable molybdenum cofactor guanylyltransferase n=1 Tax=Methanococcoides alaskense TaxID=325778 RepID=A0AA90ZC74_9EURY|nr:molybdenum cofactor guanylyltransferase [Methanococcoides alaskense]MDR6222607.1 molybdopterin-guanine dinucleotide biosynthesis protein A [Methanococcoides alaskense]
MSLSALILAGGRGRRLGNVEKSLIRCSGGRSLLERTIGILEYIVDDVIVSVRDEGQAQELADDACGKEMVFDTYQDVGPLAGMLEGFKKAKGEYIFVTACDMPFIDKEVVKFMFHCAKGHDAAVPVRNDGSIEPLCSVYRIEPLLPLIESSIRSNRKFILAPVFELDDVAKVNIELLKEFDPQLKSLININTLEDLGRFDLC